MSTDRSKYSIAPKVSPPVGENPTHLVGVVCSRDSSSSVRFQKSFSFVQSTSHTNGAGFGKNGLHGVIALVCQLPGKPRQLRRTDPMHTNIRLG